MTTLVFHQQTVKIRPNPWYGPHISRDLKGIPVINYGTIGFFSFRETSRKPRPKAIYTPLRPSTFLILSVGFKFRESSQVSLVLLLFDLEDSNVAVNFLSFPFPVLEHGSVFVVFPGSVLFRKGLELRSSQEFQTDLSRRPATSQTGEFSRKSVCFSADLAFLGDLCSDLGFWLISRPFFFDFWCWFASFCQFLYVDGCFFLAVVLISGFSIQILIFLWFHLFWTSGAWSACFCQFLYDTVNFFYKGF